MVEIALQVSLENNNLPKLLIIYCYTLIERTENDDNIEMKLNFNKTHY